MVAKKAETQTSVSRSRCPICSALDTFGDKWSLLILRDIMIFGKSTYSEFLHSPEGIATNILTRRLSRLEADGLIVKTPDSKDRRKYVYSLSQKGLDLIPMLGEMMLWSVRHNPGVRIPEQLVSALEQDRSGALAWVRERASRGEPILQ